MTTFSSTEQTTVPLKMGVLVMAIFLMTLIWFTTIPPEIQTGQSQVVTHGQIPDSLTIHKWQSMQNGVEAADYYLTWHDHNAAQPDGYFEAPNQRQGWQTKFTTQGVQLVPQSGTWMWGLTLTRYGYEGEFTSLLSTPTLNATQETITYQWDTNLSEWWVNDPAGLEQGFTLQHRPPNTGQQTPLLLEMTLTGDLTPQQEKEDKIVFVNKQGRVVLTYDKLYVIDVTGQQIPAHLQLTDEQSTIQIIVDDNNATYPLTIDPWVQANKLTASDAAASDWFGFDVAISGDIAIVGAHGNDDTGDFSGSAYIFKRNLGGADNWGEVAKLTASDEAEGDRFGRSVAINGDSAIVGAWANSDSGRYSGSAYIFERNLGGADNWGEATKLTASDAAEGDSFGLSLAINGDSAIIGALHNNDAGVRSGSVYIFERNHGGDNNWGQVTKLTANDAAAYDLFGRSVAISGDIAIVGASGNSDSGKNSGSAYIFERNHGGDNNWGQVTQAYC